MFKIGDYVFDKNNDDRVQIVDVSTVWDFVSYKVFNPVTGAVYKLSADAVEAICHPERDWYRQIRRCPR